MLFIGVRTFAAVCSVLFIVSFSSPCPAHKQVVFGSVYALTGQAAASTLSSSQGLRFGIRELNKNGGLLGRPVVLQEYDNVSTAIGSKVAAEKAVADKVSAIIGSDWSTHSLAAAPVAQKARIPMVSNISTNPKVTTVGDYIFRVCFTDKFQGSVMAEFARREMNAETAVVIRDIGSDYSMDLADTFHHRFQALGGKVLKTLSYKRNWEQYDSLVPEMLQSKPDVYFLPGYSESAVIVERFIDAGIQSVPLGGDGWATGDFMLRGGKALQRGYFCTHWTPKLSSPLSQYFVNAFQSLGELNAQAALAYDAVNLLADAVRRADSSYPKDIRDALADTKDFEGITGTISFDTNGDPIKKALIMQIRDGKVVFLKQVSPEQSETAP